MNSSRIPEQSFGLRSALYTALSVLLLFGALPLLFHVAGGWMGSRAAGGSSLSPDSSVRALIGAAIFGAGLVGYLLCAWWLMFRGRGPYIELDPPRRLVASGPYRWVRNPVVVAVLLTVLGEAIYFGSIGILLLLALMSIAVHLQVTRIEEPLLRARFGDEYVGYCAEVPRWLPRRRRQRGGSRG